jgi:hypothetical protein
VFTLTGAWLFLFVCLHAHGQTPSKTSSGNPQNAGEDKDPIAIVELGASTSWNLRGGTATFAPNLAAEATPIENWLELEAGVSPFYTRKSTEWDTDLLFKRNRKRVGRINQRLVMQGRSVSADGCALPPASNKSTRTAKNRHQSADLRPCRGIPDIGLPNSA